MASQSQNITNLGSVVSPANVSSGVTTAISLSTTKVQSLSTTSSSLSLSPSPSQSPSLSSAPSPSPSPLPSLSPSPSPAPSSPLQSSIQHQHQQVLQQSNNVEALDKSSSNTLKRNPKMELSKTDLLKLLGHLEGEVQARDIVIAALKSEKMKHLLSSRHLSGTVDPHAALARDVALVGGPMGHETNQSDEQAASLKALVREQRYRELRMRLLLQDAEIRHGAVIKELEEEKQKHEHDTAQGDDITYGLEKERTRLKKELELEKQEKKRLELELKKTNDTLDEEKNRQKQIVLLLLAERKKIIMKYIEERKRSEDLAQILSEEKVRIDSMAEGLEEESKKSLQMEAELEKQLAQFDMERQQYRQALAKEEKRAKDLELELDKLRNEMDAWKESQERGPPRRVGMTPPLPPTKPANLVAMPTIRPVSAPQTLKGAVLGTGTPMVSSKVVQPTATVSSVPVSGPTTGIARSVTPGQAIRGVAYTPNLTSTGGETTATSDTQAVEKRVIVPATVNPGGTVKLVPSTQTVGKLGFHVGSGSAVQASNMLPSKKPSVSRGVPPPVPPNKPVVPPKKEAAYLRRTESSQPPQTPQDAVKFVKQTAVHPVSGPSTPQVQQAIAAFTQASEDEVSSVARLHE